MASLQAGVVGMADVERNPTQVAGANGGRFDLSSPATWATIWAVGAFAWLTGLYFAAGGFKGSVGS